MIDTNWYVITGGPSSGKTKLIIHLAFMGYLTIPEAARALIDNEMSKGRTIEQIRADEFKFQKKVLKMKIDAENRIPANHIAFFERGIPDSIAYYKICRENIEPVVKASKKRRYKKVFLLEQLPFEKDYARTEDEELANKISKLLHDSYSSLGYELISVPVMKSIEERVNFILGKI
jgi:predicted ATPase